MRTVVMLGTLLAVLLIPWTSLAPAWHSDAAGGSINASRQEKRGGSAAWLNPALGIMPLTIDAPEDDGSPAEPQAESAGDNGVSTGRGIERPHNSGNEGLSRTRVVCEDGVCRLIDDPEAGPAENKHEAGYARLTELGASQFRLDETDDEARFACSVPVRPGSRVQRRFEAKGTNAAEALALATAEIESWLADRQ